MSVDFDAVIIGAGFGGMYMLHRLRLERAPRRGSSRDRQRASAAPGTGTALSQRALLRHRKRCEYSYQFPPAGAGMGMVGTLRDAARDPALRQSSPTALRPAPRRHRRAPGRKGGVTPRELTNQRPDRGGADDPDVPEHTQALAARTALPVAARLCRSLPGRKPS